LGNILSPNIPRRLALPIAAPSPTGADKSPEKTACGYEMPNSNQLEDGLCIGTVYNCSADE